MTLRFVTRKVAASIVALLIITAFNFFLFRIPKGDVLASSLRGRNVTAEQRAELRAEFHLNDSKWKQFFYYVRETAHGNLGISIKSRRPVSTEIAEKVWPTIWVVGISTILSCVIGLWLGILAGWRRNSMTDRLSTGFAMFTYAIPDFFLGILLLAFFSFALKWFPTGGFEDVRSTAGGFAAFWDKAKHAFLPIVTLAIAYLGEYTIIMRSALIELSGEDFITVARAKGLRDALVRRRHAVPNAMLPAITIVTVNFGFIISGAVAVETVFSYPGLGKAAADAATGDFPMLQGLFLLFTSAIVIANLITDLLYGVLDPRVRLG